jgi:hypothetical protein
MPLYLETQPQDLRLLDERKQAVAVPAEGSTLASVAGRTSDTFDVLLPGLPRPAQHIGLLQGRLSAVVPSKMLTFSFDTLARLHKAAPAGPLRKQTQEGVVCRLERLTLARDRWTVRVVLDYPAGGRKLESFQSWVVNNELALVNADGKRRRVARDYVLESSTPRRAVISYHFTDKDGARGRPQDWKVSYRTPARIIDVPIAFTFKDVPLP